MYKTYLASIHTPQVCNAEKSMRENDVNWCMMQAWGNGLFSHRVKLVIVSIIVVVLHCILLFNRED